jgi:alkanesulfonate monooxygenase SsuD/methylene tetrahydromethanopterin reductase-like flavin-dependent oxidoreductase (luciferase family)
MLGNIGVTLLNTGDMSMADIVRYAQEAEALGYEGFWSTEGDGKDPFAILAVAAHATQRINLGTSIASFYSRTPTLMAIGASTLYRMSEGRFNHFGIGTGGVYFTERGHGVKIEQPVVRARETIEIIRGLLLKQDVGYQHGPLDARPVDIIRGTSDNFSYNGRLFQLNDFRLREGRIDGKLPIYLSAIGPKMIALAARIADGVITNGLTPEAYERYISIIRREAEQVGRDPNEVKIYSLKMMGVESDESVEAVRRSLTFFFAAAHYYPVMEASGYASVAEQIQAAWRSGDFMGASRFVTDEMVEKFAIMGSAEQRRKHLSWMLDQGVYPILYPVWRPGRAVEDYFEIIRLGAQYLTAEEPALAY